MAGVQEMAILAASLLAIAIGSIWYSPLVFGSYWQRATQRTFNELQVSNAQLAGALLLALLAHGAVFTIVAYALRLLIPHGTSLSLFVVGVWVLLSAPVISMVVWERRSPLYLVIHAGYAFVTVTVGILVLTFWPW